MTPFKGRNRVTSPYGPRRNPVTGRQELHRGQDVTAPDGDWQVRECTGGVVLRVAYDAARGKYVDVQTQPGVFQRYQHMEIIRVSVGQKVPQGTVLGTAGCTGMATGRHLHFGVYRGGTAESCAVPPQQWSGLANALGTYPGSDSVDGGTAASSPLYAYSGIVASLGDARQLDALLAQLGLAHQKREVQP